MHGHQMSVRERERSWANEGEIKKMIKICGQTSVRQGTAPTEEGMLMNWCKRIHHFQNLTAVIRLDLVRCSGEDPCSPPHSSKPQASQKPQARGKPRMLHHQACPGCAKH